MKQLPLTILASALLLILVFLFASTGMSSADASTVMGIPGLAVDGNADGRLRVHGSGFRPGALITVELRQRTSQISTRMNVWVDTRGSFATEFDMAPMVEQVASVQGASAIRWDDWIIVATTSTGSLAVPLKAGTLPNQ